MRAPFWLVIALAGLAAGNVLGGAYALAVLDPSRALAPSLPLVIDIGLPVVWAVVFAWLFVEILRGRSRAFRALAPLVTAYAGLRLALLALFARADYDRGRLPFQLVLSIALLAALWLYSWRKGWLWRGRQTR